MSLKSNRLCWGWGWGAGNGSGPIDSAVAPSPLRASRGRVWAPRGQERMQPGWPGSGPGRPGWAASSLQGASAQVGLWILFWLALGFGVDSPWGCVLHRAQGSVQPAGEGCGGAFTPRPALGLFLPGSCPPLGRPARLHRGQGCWSPPLSFPPLATAPSLSGLLPAV